LARACRSYQRDRAARLRRKTQMPQLRMRHVVTERDVLEYHLAAHMRQLRRPGLFVQHLLRVEHREKIAERVRLEEQSRDERSELLEPPDQHHGETDEADDAADRHLALGG